MERQTMGQEQFECIFDAVIAIIMTDFSDWN